MNKKFESGLFDDDNDAPIIIREPSWNVPLWFSDLHEVALNQLKTYQSELFRFNEKLNLISPKTKPDADLIHFADSILAAQALFKHTDAKEIWDIGSGNGFPGLVMAIMEPNRNFILLDNDERKTEFLKLLMTRLNLQNVRVERKKLEEVPEGTIECAISRAFAPLSRALVVARKPFKLGGQYYHIKAESWATEVIDIPVQACSHWRTELVSEYLLPDQRQKNYLVLTTRE